MGSFRLSVTCHSYFGPSWQVEAQGEELSWHKSFQGNLLEEKAERLSANEIHSFIDECKKIGVFTWEPHYMHCCMLDGSTWSLLLQANEEAVQSGGTNGYPENWPEFCDLLKKLVRLATNPCKS